MNITNKASENPINSPATRATGLSAVWQNLYPVFDESEFRLLTPKEHGQLKRLKQSLGFETARQVIKYAFSNWQTFARKAAQNCGLTVYPMKPAVGFLLQHHASALVLLQDGLHTIAKKKATEEEAEKEAQANKVGKAMQETNSTQKPLTLISLTQAQAHAYIHGLDDPANEAWANKITEKYGAWRPAHSNENGIPCDVELVIGG
jgi:hypothetical protein